MSPRSPAATEVARCVAPAWPRGRARDDSLLAAAREEGDARSRRWLAAREGAR
jgi:hypothetical protein